ncbi:hypothetical protein [Gaopeijia maritima]|uniref:NfeD-like C-terminal domain-containing protein n=1 Tax=Gaopeijia maritima TaxID=3119007 RepID=A0ABU9EDU6_9BACT
MLALYLFSLIIGGGFLLLSVLGGGGEGDIDVDGGLDLDLGLDGDALDGAADLDGGPDDAASRIFSIRTVVYALFGFGATGTVLTQLGVGLITTLAFSVAGGIASGLLVSLVFHFLVKTESGEHQGDSSLVGLDGVVTLPIDEVRPGTVMVERGGRRFALRALPHSTTEGDPAAWSRVIVVDMEGGVARVAPLAADELDALGSGEH